MIPAQCLLTRSFVLEEFNWYLLTDVHIGIRKKIEHSILCSCMHRVINNCNTRGAGVGFMQERLCMTEWEKFKPTPSKNRWKKAINQRFFSSLVDSHSVVQETLVREYIRKKII
jgi:hypothetical protein